MSRYAWITFDCYGTLIDWERGMRSVFAGILQARGLPGGAEALPSKYIQYEMWVQRSGYKRYREVLAEASSMLFKSEYAVDLTEDERASLAASLPSWQPFADARPVLEQLKHRFKLGILSNIDDDLLTHSLRNLGVVFDALVTSEQVGSYKPVNNHWQEALKRFKTEPEQVLHVGGSYLHDIMPAKQLGLDCVWINRKREPMTGAFPPDIELPDLTDLPARLGG